MQFRVRWLALGQLNRRDPKTPDIRFIVVSGLLDNLRRHPVRRAHESVLLGRKRSGELARDAEIGQLNVASGREKDVCGCMPGEIDDAYF